MFENLEDLKKGIKARNDIIDIIQNTQNNELQEIIKTIQQINNKEITIDFSDSVAVQANTAIEFVFIVESQRNC